MEPLSRGAYRSAVAARFSHPATRILCEAATAFGSTVTARCRASLNVTTGAVLPCADAIELKQTVKLTTICHLPSAICHLLFIVPPSSSPYPRPAAAGSIPAYAFHQLVPASACSGAIARTPRTPPAPGTASVTSTPPAHR